MAVSWTTRLDCDECGKDISLYAEEAGGEANWPTRPAGVREVRRYAAEHLGWTRRRGRDRCADCTLPTLTTPTTRP